MTTKNILPQIIEKSNTTREKFKKFLRVFILPLIKWHNGPPGNNYDWGMQHTTECLNQLKLLWEAHPLNTQQVI